MHTSMSFENEPSSVPTRRSIGTQFDPFLNGLSIILHDCKCLTSDFELSRQLCEGVDLRKPIDEPGWEGVAACVDGFSVLFLLIYVSPA